MKIVKEIKLDLNVGDTLELLKTIVSEEGIEGSNGKLYFTGRFDDTGGSIQNKKKLFTNPPFELRISKMSDVHTRIQISYTDTEIVSGVKPIFIQFGTPMLAAITVSLLVDPISIMGLVKIVLISTAVYFVTKRFFKKVMPLDNPEIYYIMDHLEKTSQAERVY